MVESREGAVDFSARPLPIPHGKGAPLMPTRIRAFTVRLRVTYADNTSEEFRWPIRAFIPEIAEAKAKNHIQVILNNFAVKEIEVIGTTEVIFA